MPCTPKLKHVLKLLYQTWFEFIFSKLPKQIFVDIKFSELKYKFFVCDFQSVKLGLSKHVLFVWMRH